MERKDGFKTLPAIAAGLAAGLAIGGWKYFAPPGPGAPVAAVFAPGVTLSEAYARVAAGGGVVMAPGGFANVLVARADDPGFNARLREEGAWLLVDPEALATCLPFVLPESGAP